MFRSIALEVQSTPEGVFFHFPTPVSVISLTVTDEGGEQLWSLIAEEMQPVEVAGSTVSVTPMEQATPELLELLRVAQQRADVDLATQGPFKAPVSQLKYGLVPSGYRAESPAAELGAGERHVLVFAQQGTAFVVFNAG